MSEKTKIEWADSTWNPWIGCTRVSPACDDCYAARSTPARALGVEWGPGQPRRRTAPSTWKNPLRWNKETWIQCTCGYRGPSVDGGGCGACGKHSTVTPTRRRVFCASLADVFDNEVDPAWRADLLALIFDTPNLYWLLLTKRIGNVAKMLEHHTEPGKPTLQLPDNVWLGATVVNQEEADRDIPKLLAVPARVRFLSIEPMLGPIDLTLDGLVCGPCLRCADEAPDLETNAVECRACCCTGKGDEWAIDWVIAGGESGAHARPTHADWVRSLRDQCAAVQVPFLFKQHGEWVDQDNFDALPLMEPQLADPQDYFREHRWDSLGHDVSYRVGKKVAGRLLDGREWSGFPVVA